MYKALLSHPLKEGHVQCLICQRRCRIAVGLRGFCKTRRNVDGELYSLIYGRVSSIRVAPIEIKPLFHYYPGSRWLSLGSLGCNFRCPGCQNWEIAHADPERDIASTRFIAPEDLVQLALVQQCKGISWTYNEPTLWLEYTLDCANLAKQKGLLTNYVTNGFITSEALDLLGPYLDTFRVDLKGFSNQVYQRLTPGVDAGGILGVLKRAKMRWGMHIEVITNLIPGFNDKIYELRNTARWIVEELGWDTPWHITRFFPHLKLSHFPPTSRSDLEKARSIGKGEGLQFVYLGNLPGHPSENTHCPGCDKLLIRRFNFQVLEYHLNGNKCGYFGQRISGVFAPNSPPAAQPLLPL